MESNRRSHHLRELLVLRRNSGYKTINKIVRQPPPEGSALGHLARRRNLQQRGVCSARPNPQRSPPNLRSVVVLVPLDPLVLLLEQGSVHLVSSNSSSSHHNNNHRSSSLPEPGLVPLAKLSRNNRLALAPADLARRSHNSKLAAFSVVLLSVKSPPPLGSVRISYLNPDFATDSSKALQQPQGLVLSVPVPEPLVRLSPRLPLPLVLHLNNNNPRPLRSVPGDSGVSQKRDTSVST